MEAKRPSLGTRLEHVSDDLEVVFKRPSIGTRIEYSSNDIEPIFKRPCVGVRFDDTPPKLAMTAIIDNITGVMITSKYE